MKTFTTPTANGRHYRRNAFQSIKFDLTIFKRIAVNRTLHITFWVLVFLLMGTKFSQAQCVNAYQLDWSNPATYTVTCGSVNPAQWTVKKDSCNYYSPPIYVGGMVGEPDKVVSISVRINQSGNLTNNDFAWVHFNVNGVLRKMKVVRGDTVSAVFSYTDTVHVPAGGYLVIRIALKTDLNTEFWQIKNGDISGCISSTGTLPVQLIRFNALDNKSQVLLKWATASEINNAHFIIQRSLDAIEYEDVGRVKGAGNTSSISNYSISDRNPKTGINYYRLIQFDQDGKFTIYGPLVFKNAIKADPIQIYPNPISKDSRNITLVNVSNDDMIYIHKSNGELIKQMDLVSTIQGTAELNISDIGSGIYFLSVINSDRVEKTKLIIK